MAAPHPDEYNPTAELSANPDIVERVGISISILPRRKRPDRDHPLELEVPGWTGAVTPDELIELARWIEHRLIETALEL